MLDKTRHITSRLMMPSKVDIEHAKRLVREVYDLLLFPVFKKIVCETILYRLLKNKSFILIIVKVENAMHLLQI